MFRTALVLFVSLLFFACSNPTNEIKEVLPFYNSAEFNPLFVSVDSVELIINHQIDDFSFFNQNGNEITEKIIENKVHVANFMFTSCGSICPSMTNNLKTVSDSLSRKKDLVILSYSVTPWIDSIPKLLAYKEKYEIQNPNWHFLTGNTSEIYQLARQSYFAEEELGFTKDSTDFLHTEHFLLVDKTKRIRGIYNGTLQLEMLQLIADIEVLLEE